MSIVDPLYLSVLCALATAGHTEAQTPPAPQDVVLHDELHSVTGDRVRVLAARGTASTGSLQVCLRVPVALTTIKGISHDQHVAPKQWVSPGDTTCKTYAPAIHRLYLWVSDASGPHPVLARSLDLRTFSAGVVWLEWLDDAP